MHTSLNKENSKLTITVSGRVDTATAPELEKAIFDNIDGASELVLDFKDMPYTSSAGLRVLLKAQKAMLKQGEMKVINVSSDVMEVFEMTGFSEILTIE
jgi:anti-sigma B factor antagonist